MCESSVVQSFRRCVKCGGSAGRIFYSKGKDEPRGCPGSVSQERCAVEEEHVHFECGCGYVWWSRCLDAE